MENHPIWQPTSCKTQHLILDMDRKFIFNCFDNKQSLFPGQIHQLQSVKCEDVLLYNILIDNKLIYSGFRHLNSC